MAEARKNERTATAKLGKVREHQTSMVRKRLAAAENLVWQEYDDGYQEALAECQEAAKELDELHKKLGWYMARHRSGEEARTKLQGLEDQLAEKNQLLAELEAKLAESEDIVLKFKQIPTSQRTAGKGTGRGTTYP